MPFFVSQSKIDTLEQENQNLKDLIESAGGTEAVNFQNQVLQLQQQKSQLETQLKDLTIKLTQAAQTHYEINKQTEELRAIFSDATIMVDAGLANYAHPAKSSIELGEELASTQVRIKDMVRNKTAIQATLNFTFNDSASKGRKFVADMSGMMLRAYNAEAENCVLTVKAGNGEAARKRLERAKTQAERLGKMIDLTINHDYHALRLRELDLALKYQNAKKAEKEAERAEKARLREEKKAQKELEAERAKLIKEKTHYENVLAELKAQGKEADAADLEAKLKEVEKEIESVDFRVANQRAGYVYVISNIGAFGENMVKIGMTRRLDPMDRIKELSDASVPFNFDVHALFFTEDAVSVETKLHHIFADKRVNLINMRREFFAVNPLDVKKELVEIAGNLLEFVEIPEAEQYRQSIAIRQQENNN